MSNMSYCRFTNTVDDLKDCLEHLEDELSPQENKARKQLIKVAYEFVQSFLDEDGNLDKEAIEELQSA